VVIRFRGIRGQEQAAAIADADELARRRLAKAYYLEPVYRPSLWRQVRRIIVRRLLRWRPIVDVVKAAEAEGRSMGFQDGAQYQRKVTRELSGNIGYFAAATHLLMVRANVTELEIPPGLAEQGPACYGFRFDRQAGKIRLTRT
jgi:hypothetical protein